MGHRHSRGSESAQPRLPLPFGALDTVTLLAGFLHCLLADFRGHARFVTNVPRDELRDDLWLGERRATVGRLGDNDPFTCPEPRPSNERQVTYTVPTLVTPMSQN